MYYLITDGEYWQICLSKDEKGGVPAHLARQGYHLSYVELKQEEAEKLFFNASIEWPRKINASLRKRR